MNTHKNFLYFFVYTSIALYVIKVKKKLTEEKQVMSISSSKKVHIHMWRKVKIGCSIHLFLFVCTFYKTGYVRYDDWKK